MDTMNRYGKSKVEGARFAADAKAKGFRVGGHDGVVSLHKAIPIGDTEAYVACENEARRLIHSAPVVSSGSTWGSTSSSVGGGIAIDTGRFELHMSGVSKNFVKGLA
jgi:hypothetical protein